MVSGSFGGLTHGLGEGQRGGVILELERPLDLGNSIHVYQTPSRYFPEIFFDFSAGQGRITHLADAAFLFS